MPRLPAILAACLALAGVASPSDAEPPRPESSPVLDLRVSLQANVTRPGRSLWRGLGQAGISQLQQGHVEGVLASFATNEGDASAGGLAAGFASFKSTLLSTRIFNTKGCSASPKRIATWFELDAPDSLAADPSEVGLWVTRGVTVFRLVGRRDNLLASSAAPAGPTRVDGLTQEGRQVVQAILRAGALVDVSFLADSGLMEVLELAAATHAPLLATETSARAVLNRPGSLDDSQLRAVARTGGVMALSLDRTAIGDGANTGLDDVLRQLEHMIRIAGPEHVAIGSGFETGSVPPASLGNATRFPRLANAMAAQGMSRQVVRQVLHDNALRILCSSP